MHAKAIFKFIIVFGVWVFSSAAFAQNTPNGVMARAEITVRFDKDGSVKIREELDYVKPRGLPTRGIFRELQTKVRDGNVTLSLIHI